jgi:isocitrate dehydrogenase
MPIPPKKQKVTLIAGDGVGPEVTTATRRIIEAAGAQIEWEECEAGAQVFKKGLATGVPLETIQSIQRNKIALKGPLETPIGFGEKSANVTLRKLFETYGNIRPVREFPGVKTPYSGRGVDLVIVRENVEDLYAGIEYMQTPQAAMTLKLISRKGCEKIVRLAFEFARSEGRKKVHCASKANIMKMSEGMLKRVFEEIAPEYPDITAKHIIVDNAAHQMVKTPEQFDVIVTTNMNGDILSDLGSALIGGLGFAPGANIGNEVAIFEAVHGSAPKHAGNNVINPIAVLLSGVMMLRHMGEFEAAKSIDNAVLLTLTQGMLTRDVVGDAKGCKTTALTDAIIKNLGKPYEGWSERPYKMIQKPQIPRGAQTPPLKERHLIGVDIFIESGATSLELGKSLEKVAEGSPFTLKLISNRGVKVYPSAGVDPDVVNHWRARFIGRTEADVTEDQILQFLKKVGQEHMWMHIEKLQTFDGVKAFTKDQGED